MQRVPVVIVSIVVTCVMATSVLGFEEKSAAETRKIEALISHIEGLTDAKFVRNGKEYDAKTAAKFLRGKWESNAAEITTAKDFIEKAASVSSTTGKPYLIRFKDGKEVKCGEYQLGELEKLEKPPDSQLPNVE